MIVFVAQPLTSHLKNYLTQNLGLSWCEQEPEEAFFLCYQSDRLVLKKKQSREHGIYVDFLEMEKEWRRQKISPKKDLLAKAIGVEKGLKVCDLTLGLANDSYKLCYFGAQIQAFEKNTALWALSQDALWRYQQFKNTELPIRAQNISFLKGINEQLSHNDVFYLDPMYEHERSALPRKEMQYLAEVTVPTSEEDLRSVCEIILAHKKKLIVKRAPQALPLCGLNPKRSVTGKMVRFDIY